MTNPPTAQRGPVMLGSSDGVDIALHHSGGSGPSVIFCHATGFHGRTWDPITEALGDRYDCWAIDFRGHGDSTLPEGTPLVWTGMSHDLGVAVDHIAQSTGQAPSLAVGHSMGGAAIAMTELERPGTFSTVFLFEPILFPALTENMERRGSLSEGARRRRDVFESFDAAYERYASRPPLNNFDPRALRAYVDHGFRPIEGGVKLKCAGSTEADVFDNSDNRAYERLADIPTVTMIAVGGDDAGPATIGPDITERLPNGVFHVDESLSHFGPMEEPDLFADLIDRHLSSRSPS